MQASPYYQIMGHFCGTEPLTPPPVKATSLKSKSPSVKEQHSKQTKAKRRLTSSQSLSDLLQVRLLTFLIESLQF